MLSGYFKTLYRDTMSRAYSTAYEHIATTINADSALLDCGASDGHTFDVLRSEYGLLVEQYSGIEWSKALVHKGKEKGLDITQGDLNKVLPYETDRFSCIYGLSVLEHLLNPCHYLRECHRVLRPGGRIVLLTPNISTYFTIALLAVGKMPSSGPHPDSNELLRSEEVFKVSSDTLQPDTEIDTPSHRHLVVFSYRILHKYLQMTGFKNVVGRGFGLYPFPKFLQGGLERLDPYHCHQMVFVAEKK